MSHASGLVEELRKQVYDPLLEGDACAISSVLKQCTKVTREINKVLKETTSIGVKNHLSACLSQVKSYREIAKALKIVGEGYKPRKETACDRVKWVDMKSAFKSRIRTGVITNIKHIEPKAFMSDCSVIFKRRILKALKKDVALKVNATFCGLFEAKKGDAIIEETKYMNTKNVPVYRDSDLTQWFDINIVDSILKDLEEFQQKESGWTLKSIINLQVNINKYTPQLGSSYIDLPEQINMKKACINVKNDDEACFAWAVVSALHPTARELNSSRVSSYPHYSKVLNLTGIQFPMTLGQVSRFEHQNSLSINVYILEKQEGKKKFIVVPTYLTKNKQDKHVNLLLLQDVYYDEDDDVTDLDFKPRFHYVWIKNLSRLLSSQLSRNHYHKFFCDRCLHYFSTQQKLSMHEIDCVKMNDCKVRLPTTKQANVVFKNYKNKEPTPFVIYADLECLLVPTTEKDKVQDHIPHSIAYYVKCSYDDTLSFYRAYRGEDCQEWFAREMQQFAEDVETVFLCPLPMDTLSPEQDAEFRAATHCHICLEPFAVDNVKVRDHCHLTGRYRGSAHDNCNINYKDSHVVPVVFHNLSGYDSHFIIKNLASDFDGRVDLLPINKERYISFTKNIEQNLVKFRFIDSFRFLASGLETLASYLDIYPNLKSQFPDLDDTRFKILTRKGVFPYDYINDWTKLDETQLPDKSKFYNSLTDTAISDEHYTHAEHVWGSFGCQNLGEYSDLYLKTDVLLLADVFEQFRSSSLKTYGLDPAHYYTLPGYTWDCMLKSTKINLELLTDIDKVLFIERGIRGGLSQCSKRYAEANNKFLPNYNPEEPSKFLLYADINNQYGWAMSQYLPYGGFEWVEGDNLDNFNFNVSTDNPEGYILEVNLDYPKDIHDAHADLPFCPEHRTPPNSKETKLMATLTDKKRYIIHYRNLQQCLENGLKLTKIHRVLKFKQSDWLRSYIDLNTELRKQAKNEFEKNLFKLMNNAVFGKTMEDIRKHSIVKLISRWEGRYGAEAMISKPNFKSSTIFAENLVAIELNKTEVYFNKPIYVGMCILDISKLKLYDFHYSYMRRRFGDKARVCYTDTDSLVYVVETPNLYEVIKQDAHEHFDTSDYPDDNIYGIPRVNKKVLGLMKDENAGKVMTHFVGLRSKMYSSKTFRDEDEEMLDQHKMMQTGKSETEIRQALENRRTVKKAKGVKKHIVKNIITFDDYVSCLSVGKETSVQQKLFRSDKHRVSTISQTKIALSPHDDKRYIIPGSHDTLPWGHYSIPQNS